MCGGLINEGNYHWHWYNVIPQMNYLNYSVSIMRKLLMHNVKMAFILNNFYHRTLLLCGVCNALRNRRTAKLQSNDWHYCAPLYPIATATLVLYLTPSAHIVLKAWPGFARSVYGKPFIP